MKNRRRTEEDQRYTMSLVVLAVVLVLIIAGLWLTDQLRQVSKLQDCAMQGRRNCAPIDAPAR